RARALMERFSRVPSRRTRIEAADLAALANSTFLTDSACVINATSMGLTTRRFAPIDYGSTPQDCFFYDMLYSRTPTPFLAGAARSRRKCADGAGMLVEQGELAFKLFNGVPPPPGVMRKALDAALGR